MFNIKKLLARALMALSLVGGAAVAGPTYHVDVDTTTLAGKSGYLDFLIVGQGDTATTTAKLSHFTGDFSGAVYTDNTTGSTAGATVGSTGSWNEFALWANFGGQFSFDVSFDQIADNIAGALFQVALLDGGFLYLDPLTADIAQFDVSPGQPIGLAGSDLATISVAADVPEPADAMLMLTGLGLLGFTLRRRA
ncbi:NF038129 family PEP-CTERM protein [Massilia aerilata]|uniref:NF038129 family PEP-CTERM protein n=1 Tax=Massilia aerilata TaxID=453817 RepID=A0ABW0S1G0_9BURK